MTSAAPAAGLPLRARPFLVLVLAAAAAIAAPLLLHLGLSTDDWVTFGTLAVGAAAAQLFAVVAPPNQAFYTVIAFLVATALLLPPQFLPLVAVAQHLPEWLKCRYAWYIQTFNIANYTLDLLGAWAAAHVAAHVVAAAGADPRVSFAVAAVAAVAAFVALNHILLAMMLRLARVDSFRETRLFTLTSISVDAALGALGVMLAVAWRTNAWVAPLAVVPLIVIHRSLAVPQLELEARLDPKTGLFNARQFARALDEELARAARFERPLALLMVDLDHLRDLNNEHGHLAGDAVLLGVADVFRTLLRQYDVAARFGGEEFAILLPETSREDAQAMAERIRLTVAATAYDVPTQTEPVRASVSIGVAEFPLDARDATRLLHQADLAVYRAKMQGRNRVLLANPELVAETALAAPTAVSVA